VSRRLEGRNGSIYRAYVLGATQEALAERHGIGQQHVSEIIRSVQAQLPEADLDERRKRALEALDVMSQVAAEVVELEPTQAFSNGRAMFDDAGRPILDYGPRLAGLDRFLKVADRQAKLLGLDAATKVEVGVTEQARQAAAQAAADAVAFLHGGPDEDASTPE
jgi:hypothetical protein